MTHPEPLATRSRSPADTVRQQVFWRLALIASLFGTGLVVAEVFDEPLQDGLTWVRSTWLGQTLAQVFGPAQGPNADRDLAPPPPDSPAAALVKLSRDQATRVQPLPSALRSAGTGGTGAGTGANGSVTLMRGLMPVTGLGWPGAIDSRTAAAQAIAHPQWSQGSFPVENFQGYTSDFGDRENPLGGKNTEFHRGLDLAAPQGSYVRNWWSGRVLAVREDALCGTSILIQSGHWQHVYCHLDGRPEGPPGRRSLRDRTGQFQVTEGQVLATGARIARVGLTGRTNGPHLHWGLKHSDQWIDPALILRAMYEQQRAQQATSPQRQPQR